jgi:hypothetical protein
MTDTNKRQERLAQKYEALDKAIDGFQWGRGDTLLGEVYLDRDANMLRLEVFVWDTDKDMPEEMDRLLVSIEVDPYKDARQQIRELIHFHITHEADEQMSFTDQGYIDQPFYPHNPDGSLR